MTLLGALLGALAGLYVGFRIGFTRGGEAYTEGFYRAIYESTEIRRDLIEVIAFAEAEHVKAGLVDDAEDRRN